MKYLGFISYAHDDSTDLVEDLDSYLTKHTDIETFYDGHVPEGEKLENILEQLPLCDILILVITPDALTSKPVEKEIKLAEEKNLKIIPCKIKHLNKEWNELPWDLSKYKGFVFENKYELRRLALFALDKILEKLDSESKEKESVSALFSETKKVLEPVPEILQLDLDNNIYSYDDEVTCSIVNTNTKSKNPMKLTVLNDKRKIVYEKPINLKPNEFGYVEKVTLSGEYWLSKSSGSYLVVLEHEGKKDRKSFYLAYFGVSIELDQKVYTWTDKVYITVIAPNLNKDSMKNEKIGNDKKSWLTIQTREKKLEGYELIETGSDTGIFTGEIKLTGFANYDAKGDGKIEKFLGNTSGSGPTDGQLGCRENDGIKVGLKVNDIEYSGAALIRWNIGEIQWNKPEYKIADTGTIIVIDPDANLNPDLIDLLPIRIWSDSDPIGMTLTAVETGVASGIFFADIQFGDKTSNVSLKVQKGDSVVAEYIDRTLPDPYAVGHNLKINSISKII